MASLFIPVSPSTDPAQTAPGSILWKWITFNGPDAQDFLHRLTTVNTRAMQPGEGAKGSFLTAQGKIRAYFTLWNYGPGDYGFEFDAGKNGYWKDALLQVVDQFTFGEKLAIADVTGMECRWIFSEKDTLPAALGAPDLKAGQTVAIDEEIRICHQGSVDFGRTWITAWGLPGRLNQWLDRTLPGSSTITREELETWRIQALRPWVDHEITENTIPLEVGLMDSIAESKGCYPGQEVIERMISLGSPARKLCRIVGMGAIPPLGSALMNQAEPPAEVGTLTSVVATGEGFQALALLRKIHAKEGMEVALPNGKGTVAQVMK